MTLHRDLEAEAEMKVVTDAITALRKLRANNNVKQSEMVEAFLEGRSVYETAILLKNSKLISDVARVSKMHVHVPTDHVRFIADVFEEEANEVAVGE